MPEQTKIDLTTLTATQLERDLFWSRVRHLVFHAYYGRHHIIYKLFGLPVWARRWDRDAMNKS